MKKKIMRLTSFLAIIFFSIVSYVETSAADTENVTLPVDTASMEKEGYDFAGFFMDKEALLAMITSSANGLSSQLEDCDDPERRAELQKRIDGLNRDYGIIAASEQDKIFLTDEEGNIITGAGSLYEILGFMRGGVDSLDIDSDWDMTPREILVSGNGNSTLFYYKDGKCYSDKDVCNEITNIGDVGGSIIMADCDQGHFNGAMSESGLKIVDADGNILLEDVTKETFENNLGLSANAQYYQHLQLLRSDRYGDADDEDKDREKVSADYYYDGQVLYLDRDYNEKAENIAIPFIDTDGNLRSWTLYDIIHDYSGNEQMLPVITFRPVAGDKVVDVVVTEHEEGAGDSAEAENGGADQSDPSQIDNNTDSGDSDQSVAGAKRAASSKYAEVTVYLEKDILGYVAYDTDGQALFVIENGGINYDKTEIEAEAVDVEAIKAEALAKWEEENKQKEQYSKDNTENSEAAAEASSLDENDSDSDEAATDASMDDKNTSGNSESADAAANGNSSAEANEAGNNEALSENETDSVDGAVQEPTENPSDEQAPSGDDSSGESVDNGEGGDDNGESSGDNSTPSEDAAPADEHHEDSDNAPEGEE